MAKFSECKLKSVKARNEYILQLESTNAALNKYYGKDVLSLLEVCVRRRVCLLNVSG